MSDEQKLPRTPPRSTPAKTIIIWSVVVVMFVCVYSMFTAGQPRVAKPEPNFTQYVSVVVAVLVLVFVAAWAFNLRKAFRFLREQHVALAALHQGDFAKARQMFWTWSESGMGRIAALSRHNLAWTLMRQGELKYAIEIARHTLERYSSQLAKLNTLPTTLVDLALLHALVGDLDAAQKAMEEVEQRKDVTGNAMFPAMKVFARAVIDCRSGRSPDAARLLDENGAAAEASLTGDVMRPLRIVRAFAIATADARDAGKAAVQLTNARPAYRGEYDFLGVAWPEMQTFLVTHELATPGEQPS